MCNGGKTGFFHRGENHLHVYTYLPGEREFIVRRLDYFALFSVLSSRYSLQYTEW